MQTESPLFLRLYYAVISQHTTHQPCLFLSQTFTTRLPTKVLCRGPNKDQPQLVHPKCSSLCPQCSYCLSILPLPLNHWYPVKKIWRWFSLCEPPMAHFIDSIGLLSLTPLVPQFYPPLFYKTPDLCLMFGCGLTSVSTHGWMKTLKRHLC